MPLEANSPTVRAAIYARYSSDLQSAASIEDQVRICRALVDAHGWEVAHVYSDSAMSGASIFRPGYQKLLLAAPGHGFEIVVAEGLDRLPVTWPTSRRSTSICRTGASGWSRWPRVRSPTCMSGSRAR